MRAAPTLLLAVFACRSPTKDEDTPEYEGDAAGECGDGADNDRDGYFDCEDNGCWGSPDCEGEGGGPGGGEGGGGDTDADTDADTDTDPDTDADTDGEAIAAHYTGFTLDYTLSWDFDDAYADLLASYGLADCVNTYAASGTQVAAAGSRVTFEGPWSLVSSTCAPDLQGAVWTDESGRSHATFAFAGDATALDQWIQHRDADDTEPLPGAAEQGQWYITALGETLSGGQTDHTEEETTVLEGLIPLTLEHAFTVRFTEG